MGFSNGIALAIMVTAAATLNAAGVKNVQNAADAARALRPLAGPFAEALFALGIVGTGLLAVPVLAGSAAYGVGEALRWPTGLDRAPREAKAFYGTIAAATAAGVVLNMTPIDPIRALFWSAVVNGVVAVPIMAIMMIMAANPKVMGAVRHRTGAQDPGLAVDRADGAGGRRNGRPELRLSRHARHSPIACKAISRLCGARLCSKR